MSRVRQFAWRAIPLLLLLALYWPGLTNWFYQDDFGWLNLRREVHSAADLGRALFAPKAHGNMRALGDNAYFLVFSSLFGMHPLPFRIWAFATQMGSLLLLGAIVVRLTGSSMAGFLAQILWIANTSVADTMSWTCIYNQILSGFFFLLAFYFLLRHVETGEKRFYIAQWTAFVLGLGALEINVVYPVLATVYALLFAKSYWKKIAPMFLISGLWTIVHFYFAPAAHGGPYALHLDARILSTFWEYWKLALGPPRLAVVRPGAAWVGGPALAILTAGALGTLAWAARKRDFAGLFGAAWFVTTLAPYLALPDHIMAYYLAVPSIGLAMLGAWAFTRAWLSGIWKAGSVACLAAYLCVSIPASWAVTNWHHDRGTRVEDLVLGVVEIHRQAPGKIILLDGVDTDLFWSGIADLPFRAMEIPHVYLTPGSEAGIEAPAELVTKYSLPPEPALHALKAARALVYRAAPYGASPALRNITERYRMTAESEWKSQTPRFINLGDSVFDEYLGPGWNRSDDGYRWLARSGVLRIAGPREVKERLHIGIFRVKPFELELRLNGIEVPTQLARRDFDLSEFTATPPRELIGTLRMEISLSARPAEPLKFGFVEIR